MIKNDLLFEKLSDKALSRNEDVNRNIQSVVVWQDLITTKINVKFNINNLLCS